MRYSRVADLRRQIKFSIPDGHGFLGRNDIDVVCLDQGFLAVNLLDRQRRMPAEEISQITGMLGVKVLDEHIGHAAVCRNGFEKVRKCFQASCRGADTNNGKLIGIWRWALFLAWLFRFTFHVIRRLAMIQECGHNEVRTTDLVYQKSSSCQAFSWCNRMKYKDFKKVNFPMAA